MADALIAFAKKELFSSSKKKALKPLISLLGLWALEKLLESSKFYNCPEEGYVLYGGSFLFGPALCFTALSLIMSNSFWDIVTSCSRGNVDRVVLCRTTCHALIKSTMLGLMWLILTFSTTDYFVCFRVGKKPKDSSETIKMQRLSLVLAWLILVISIVLALVYVAVEKCLFSRSRECSGTLLYDYERIEAEAAVSTFKKEAKALAKQEGERQVKAILNEIKDGKTTLEVVEKAKKWIIERYSRFKKLNMDSQVTNRLLEEVRLDNSTNKDSHPC